MKDRTKPLIRFGSLAFLGLLLCACGGGSTPPSKSTAELSSDGKSVRLSPDRKKLYIQNREGYVNIYDISNVKAPLRLRIVDKSAVAFDPVTDGDRYLYLPKGEKGLRIYDNSDSAHRVYLADYTASPVYGLILADHETKALTATKHDTVDLLDLSDPEHIRKIGTHPVGATAPGISSDPDSGLLFVACGGDGVKVFNLNIFIDAIY